MLKYHDKVYNKKFGKYYSGNGVGIVVGFYFNKVRVGEHYEGNAYVSFVGLYEENELEKIENEL